MLTKTLKKNHNLTNVFDAIICFFLIIINVGIWVNMYVPQLISRVLKLTIM
jgi:hypothetical protein